MESGDLLHQLHSIQPGHHDIRHDDVDRRLGGAEQLERFGPVRGLEHLVTIALQHPNGKAADGSFVVYHQHGRILSPPGTAGWRTRCGYSPADPPASTAAPCGTRAPGARDRETGECCT